MWPTINEPSRRRSYVKTKNFTLHINACIQDIEMYVIKSRIFILQYIFSSSNGCLLTKIKNTAIERFLHNNNTTSLKNIYF